jgi:hypothetical protein
LGWPAEHEHPLKDHEETRRMEPKTKDLVGVATLVIVLAALVVLIVMAGLPA